MSPRSLWRAPLIVAALFCVLTASAVAAPALWLVQSPVGKVYLFGTVHLLRDTTPWRSLELDTAIKESTTLYLEIADPGNMSDAISAIMKLGIDRDHPLSTKISKTDVALLDKTAKRYGLPGETLFEPMRPWLAEITLMTLPAMRSGYVVKKGGDISIDKEFRSAGKSIVGFETMEGQAHMFADIPEPRQIAMLEATLTQTDAESSVDRLDAIVSAWTSGDQDKLADVIHFKELSGGSAGDALLGNRNKAWVATLAERLKQPGTSFVAVGAAHMLGSDGVPALLEKMGFSVTRVPIAQTYVAQTAPAPAEATSAAPSPQPTPTPAPTPIPRTLTPPQGWKTAKTPPKTSGMITDKMWLDPQHSGILVAGHIDLGEGAASADLDALDVFFHQGLIAAAGSSNVRPSKHVKICGGKQDGIYAKVWLRKQGVKEDIVLAASDRAYLGQYVRPQTVKDDPAALRSLLTLCAPNVRQ